MNAIIIGGGASGIACAIKLKQNNSNINVTVIEHLDCILKKIYATGNGRCNMTNKTASSYEVTKEFFGSIGLVMRSDSEGRMYPYSNQASTVVDIMTTECERLGVDIVTECDVTKVEHIGDTYNVYTNKGIFTGEALILATGGKSQSALGSDGSGYDIAKQLGHSVTALSPALVQLKSSSKHCRALKGIRTKCNIKIETNGSIVAEDYGELLFADYGISGIVVMNLSSHIHDYALKNNQEKSIAIIDFVPEMSADEIKAHIEKFGNIEGILPQKLCSILSRQADGDNEKFIKCIKSWRLIITGTKGYGFAQITNGGVPNDEIDEHNMSKSNELLYIIGELTNNQFECGGFNLDYAFSSGIRAANDIYNRYNNDKN